jgi:hypothetical protein
MVAAIVAPRQGLGPGQGHFGAEALMISLIAMADEPAADLGRFSSRKARLQRTFKGDLRLDFQEAIFA